MQLHDIKQVSIVDYLAQAGYKPKLTKGVNYWYCSPLRSELTPSFKVNAERNQWYDLQETTETSLTSFAPFSIVPQQKLRDG